MWAYGAAIPEDRLVDRGGSDGSTRTDARV